MVFLNKTLNSHKQSRKYIILKKEVTIELGILKLREPNSNKIPYYACLAIGNDDFLWVTK